ncbi:MAG: glycosyltransferase family 4 protein [Halioglobus sp.]
MDLKVFFASKHGLDPYQDKNFDREIKWESLKLDFDHTFLPGAANRKPSAKIDCHAVVDSLVGFDPDIVLVYGYIQPLQRRVMRWAKANGRQLLLVGDSELRQARGRVKGFVKKLWLPRVFSSIDLFLTVGDANEAYYRSYGVPDYKFVRMFFPIDTTSFDQSLNDREQQRARVRRLLGIPHDHMVVLMVGKLVSWKRQADLVKVSNLLQSGSSQITIVLAGTGPDSDRLNSEAQASGPGGVVFAGFIPPEELVHYYLAADVYVHCSAKEPHSLAISEAIYAGLPVVVSDRCGSYGPSDDVQVGLNGYVYPCGDVTILAALLEKYSKKPTVRQRLGSESRRIGTAHQTLAHAKSICQVVDALAMIKD